jgi:pimeloyl-ACP methyl ester carboxylesterase
MSEAQLAPAHRGTESVQHVEVAWGKRRDSIEYCWIEAGDERAELHAARPRLLVFLHEGLGSLAMWKLFPAELCRALSCRGLVFSRWGYGTSSPRPPEVHWGPQFMHEQARDFLPALFRALQVDTDSEPPWLFGHSDGGSIALIHAALFPARVAGIIAAAPHVNVEPISVASIARTREAYLRGGLRERLARYHLDPDSAFWGWNDIWLDPVFRDWDIEALLPSIRCPVLAVQGVDDEYGTMAHVERIGAAVADSEIVKLPDCGHAPHRDQRDALITAVARFIERRQLAPR